MNAEAEMNTSDGLGGAGPVIDLAGPTGGRYWRVVSGHPPDHPDARAAAAYARATGSVGCTYNDVTVERAKPALEDAVRALVAEDYDRSKRDPYDAAHGLDS